MELVDMPIYDTSDPPCPHCNGDGWVYDEKYEDNYPCDYCDGTGIEQFNADEWKNFNEDR